MMDVATLGLFYALPLTLWILFLVIVARVLKGATLEDGLAYLVFLRNRRIRFIALLVVLAASQIVKDAIQVAWGLGSLGESPMLVAAIACNTVSAGALVGLVWTLLTKGSLTPAEDRVLSEVAEAMYAVGHPKELVDSSPSESKGTR